MFTISTAANPKNSKTIRPAGRFWARNRTLSRNPGPYVENPRLTLVTTDQGGELPKILGGTAIAYKVENALKSP